MAKIRGVVTGGKSISDKKRPGVVAVYHVERTDMTYKNRFILYYTKSTKLGFSFPIEITFEEFHNPETGELEAVNVEKA